MVPYLSCGRKCTITYGAFENPAPESSASAADLEWSLSCSPPPPLERTHRFHQSDQFPENASHDNSSSSENAEKEKVDNNPERNLQIANIKTCTYFIYLFFGTTKNKYFVAVVNQVSPVINVRFMKHVSNTKNIFVNPDIDDTSMITDIDIAVTGGSYMPPSREGGSYIVWALKRVLDGLIQTVCTPSPDICQFGMAA